MLISSTDQLIVNIIVICDDTTEQIVVGPHGLTGTKPLFQIRDVSLSPLRGCNNGSPT